ncbi:CobW family GTP-binding protein [Umezawaea beigongshangensis]|uniref:CobW family GTP-binding protein n=1 Tax=Umezawaea beigongshangensis TaxID=2780383 RepID=UPI0018F1222A|nr:GTP-binding protein [Umezawaea beigongshangensis]
MARSRIPVVIVAGFLGSGKTTLLNHLLGNRSGTRVGVLVNDFGSIEIDAMAVAGQVDSMVSLGNGCLCCAVDGSEVDELLARLARPANRLDVIVVEASGLAEPQPVVRTVLASSADRIEYGGLVEVVDAAEFPATRARHPELGEHLSFADLVVLNKSDRVGEEELTAVAAEVRDLAPDVPLVRTAHGRVDPELLFDRVARPERDDVPRQLSFSDLHEEDHRDHAHTRYDTAAFSCPEPLHPLRFADFLDARPEGLYRVKGVVHFGVPGHRQRYEVHTVGRYLRFRRTAWRPDEPRGTNLVLIGTGLDVEETLAALRACVEHDPESVEPSAMRRVLRHTG